MPYAHLIRPVKLHRVLRTDLLPGPLPNIHLRNPPLSILNLDLDLDIPHPLLLLPGLLRAARRFIEPHLADEPARTLLPSCELRLAERRASRGVLCVDEIRARATGEAHERLCGAEVCV